MCGTIQLVTQIPELGLFFQKLIQRRADVVRILEEK